MKNQTNSPTKEIAKAYVMEKGARTAALEIVVKIAEMQSQLVGYSLDSGYDRKKIIRLHGDIIYAMRMLEFIFSMSKYELLQGHTLANMAIVERTDGGVKC